MKKTIFTIEGPHGHLENVHEDLEGQPKKVNKMEEEKRDIMEVEMIVIFMGAIIMCISFIYLFGVIFAASGLTGELRIYINNYGEGIPELIIFIVYLIICIDFIRRGVKNDNIK